jgi:3-methyl-2-oxobutanoate hydroxymethyltransferase
MMGLRTGKAPRFVRRYADLHAVMLDAARAYAADVRGGEFPGPEHTFES